MKSFNLKHIGSAFLVGLIIGILIPYLFFFNENEPDSATTLITPQQILDREKEINTTFNRRINNLETKNSVLQKSLDSARYQLTVIKEKTKKRVTTIKKMVEPVGIPASSLLKNNQDSSSKDCDSLKKEVSSFLAEIEQKDSAYESEIQFLTESLTNKDSIILLLRWQQQEKDTLLATAVQQLELVNNENQQLRKTIKRRKFGATLKTIGLMIATGAATHAMSNF